MTGFRRGLSAAAIAFAVTTSAATTTAVAQPATMTLGTASVGGTYLVYGGVIADLLTEKAGIQVTPRQTQGPNQNVILVDEKKIELGMTTMGVALQAVQGSAAWTKGKKHENIRALFPMYDTPLQCVALKKSGIDELPAARRQDGRHRAESRHGRNLFPADLRRAGHEGDGAQRPERRHGQSSSATASSTPSASAPAPRSRSSASSTPRRTSSSSPGPMPTSPRSAASSRSSPSR